jgi:pyruvate/2-oxoacid:ferredoxin oxidoreductase alpha subunit
LDALGEIELVSQAFATTFSRDWGGLIWGHLMDDAEHALVSMGTLASECTIAAESLRKEGLRVGVVGVRAYRPFPALALARRLSSIKSVTVFEKDISYGYGGALATDLKAGLFDAGLAPHFSSRIGGLGGRDVRPEQIAQSASEAILGDATFQWLDVRG